MMSIGLAVQLLMLIGMFMAGVVCSQITGEAVVEPDHGGIVIDDDRVCRIGGCVRASVSTVVKRCFSTSSRSGRQIY
jgi:hypothetical protein